MNLNLDSELRTPNSNSNADLTRPELSEPRTPNLELRTPNVHRHTGIPGLRGAGLTHSGRLWLAWRTEMARGYGRGSEQCGGDDFEARQASSPVAGQFTCGGRGHRGIIAEESGRSAAW